MAAARAAAPTFAGLPPSRFTSAPECAVPGESTAGPSDRDDDNSGTGMETALPVEAPPADASAARDDASTTPANDVRGNDTREPSPATLLSPPRRKWQFHRFFTSLSVLHHTIKCTAA